MGASFFPNVWASPHTFSGLRLSICMGSPSPGVDFLFALMWALGPSPLGEDIGDNDAEVLMNSIYIYNFL